MSKMKIYCLFRMEEYIQVFTLSDEEERKLREVTEDEEYVYGEEYELVDGFLISRGVFTQDPQLTYIVTDGVMVIDDKGEQITTL